jgi:hypothetical protein
VWGGLLLAKQLADAAENVLAFVARETSDLLKGTSAWLKLVVAPIASACTASRKRQTCHRDSWSRLTFFRLRKILLRRSNSGGTEFHYLSDIQGCEGYLEEAWVNASGLIFF